MPTPTSYEFQQAYDIYSLTTAIENSDILVALDHIDVTGEVTTVIFKDVLPEPQVEILNDVVANYEMINPPPRPPSEVVTQLEKNDKVLKLASSISDFTGDEAIMQIRVPGTFTGVDHETCDGRYIAGGYGWTDAYLFGDRISKVEVVDVDNLFGYGANTVVKCYHDEHADEANMGWRLWASLNGEGEVEIDPIGGYGYVPSGLYIRVTFAKGASSPATKAAVNIWWGRRE